MVRCVSVEGDGGAHGAAKFARLCCSIIDELEGI
jgi:hypothetical protein